MRKLVSLLIVCIGILIGGLAYWPMAYEELNYMSLNTWLIVCSASLITSLFIVIQWDQDPLKTALFLTLGVIFSVILRIFYDTLFTDPSSHNLAPFEVIISFLQAFPAVIIGGYSGKLIKLKLSK